MCGYKPGHSISMQYQHRRIRLLNTIQIRFVQDYISAKIGQHFIEPPAFDLNACYKDGGPASPLIFVLSSGADPMADLLKLADDYRFAKKFEKVASSSPLSAHPVE